MYICTPQGVDMQPNQDLKLNRSLYGLKQAAATWFRTISIVSKDMSFVACVSDMCVFVRRDGNLSWVFVAFYVDDMLIGGVSVDSIKQVADELSIHFRLKTLGKVRFKFGIEVVYEMGANQVKISQSACITRKVEKFNQVDAKTA